MKEEGEVCDACWRHGRDKRFIYFGDETLT
jgi:hypothetical protein